MMELYMMPKLYMTQVSQMKGKTNVKPKPKTKS